MHLNSFGDVGELLILGASLESSKSPHSAFQSPWAWVSPGGPPLTQHIGRSGFTWASPELQVGAGEHGPRFQE